MSARRRLQQPSQLPRDRSPTGAGGRVAARSLQSPCTRGNSLPHRSTRRVSSFTAASGKWNAKNTWPGNTSSVKCTPTWIRPPAARRPQCRPEHQPSGVSQMQVQALGGQQHQIGRTPRHCARVVMLQPTAGHQDHGVPRIRLLARRQIWPGTQRRPAVRRLEPVEVERGLARIVYGAAGPMQCAFGLEPAVAHTPNSGATAAHSASAAAGSGQWRSAPRLEATALRMSKSVRACGGGGNAGRTRWKRRSKLTNVPSFSRNEAAGSTTSASSAVLPGEALVRRRGHRRQGRADMGAVRVGLRDVLAHDVQRQNPPFNGGVEHLGDPETGTAGFDTCRSTSAACIHVRDVLIAGSRSAGLPCPRRPGRCFVPAAWDPAS